MISTASGRRQSPPIRAVRKVALRWHRLDSDQSYVMAEQCGIDQRVELRQRFGAQFLGIDLQDGGDAGKLGELHATPAAFPLPDTFRGDVERLGDLRLEQR